MTDKAKRQEATQFIVNSIKEMLPAGENSARIEQQLNAFSDEDFAKYMKAISKGLEGEECVRVILPNFGKDQVDVRRNLQFAEKVGVDFYPQIYMGSDDPDTPEFLTPNKYMVMYLPVRRQAQLQIEGISVAEHHQTIDQRTGAPTRDSAAAKVSYPELEVLMAMGMEDTTRELIKFRGGDVGGFDAMNTVAVRDGEVSLAAIEQYSTGVGAVKAVADMFTAMHIVNSMNKK